MTGLTPAAASASPCLNLQPAPLVQLPFCQAQHIPFAFFLPPLPAPFPLPSPPAPAKYAASLALSCWVLRTDTYFAASPSSIFSISTTEGSVPVFATAPSADHFGSTADNLAVIFLRDSRCWISDSCVPIAAAFLTILRHSANVSFSRCFLPSVSTGGVPSHSVTTSAASSLMDSR